MATPRSQRIGIWVITIVLIIGTLGSFIAMAFSAKNQQTDAIAQSAENQKLQVIYSEYQAKVDAQNKTLSDKYFSEISQYSSLPAAFDASSVTELKINDLKIGDGEEITSSSTYSAYYIGWNPKGVIFDQSIDGTSLKTPIANTGLIDGWNEGVIGMKIGGVRELTIPSAKAYKDADKGENIPPNTPLKFVILAIPRPEDVPMPQELIDYYMKQVESQS